MRHARTSTIVAEAGPGRSRGLIRLVRTIGLVSCLTLPLALIAGDAAPAEAGAKARIAFVGDSLAQQYWAGIFRLVGADPCLKSNLDLGRYAKPATGLANSEYFNWLREIGRVGEVYRPTLTVISIGMNDRLPIVAPGVRIMRGTPAWSEKYRQLIKEFIEGAMANQASVLFVGLPVMRQNLFNADMAEENKLYAEVVAKIGSPRVRYVEPWKLSASGPDMFAANASDKNGKLVQIRSSDGMHFANAGEDLLALYLLPKIVAALAEAGIKVDQCAQAKIAQ
jgi:hypothetical protein